jgi:predicted GTPase
MDQLAGRQHIFDASVGRDLFESVASIQDIAVDRTPIDSSRIKKLLDDAVRLTEMLKIRDYSDIVKRVQLGIEKAIEVLSHEEQEAKE